MKVLLFDLDGTLVNTEHLDDVAMKIALEKNGLPMLKEFIGCTLDEYISAVTKDKKLHEKIKEDFLFEYENILENAELKINHELLKLLKRLSNLKIGLVTSNNKKLTTKILKKLDIHELFDTIVTSEDVKNQKPHPEPYLKALKKLKAKPEEVIGFEDTLTGLESAKNAGIHSHHVKVRIA
jgi:HAD superfamily hydrolase (TIGR01509 family)